MADTMDRQFTRFFDDAAVFPPGLASLHDAVADYVTRRSTSIADLVGPLVLPLSDIAEARRIASHHDLAAGPIQISAIVPAGSLGSTIAAREACGDELRLVSLELKISADNNLWQRELTDAAAIDDILIYAELSSEQIAAGALQMFRDSTLRLKFRTGGVEARLFPSPAELAGVIVESTSLSVTFKLTAGLHEAVRHFDSATGFTHHGFLNIAAATAAAQTGADRATVSTLLALDDRAALLAAFVGLDRTTWRSSFASFGTCSIVEPVATLRDLGLLTEEAPRASASPDRIR